MKLLFFSIFSIFGFCFYAQNKMDEKGKKQGFWIKYQEGSPKKAYEGSFKDDKPQGLFKFYFKDFDNLQSEINYLNDGKIAYATIYLMDGKVQAKGKYVNELKDSTWVFFDALGNLLSKENYSNGKKHGISQVFYPEGIVSEEKNFKMDKLDGKYLEFYIDKTKKSERNYSNGELNGKNVFYYPNGVEASVQYYKNGILDGVWIYKDKSGKITEKEVYVDGKKLSEKQATEYLKKKSTNNSKDKKVENKKNSSNNKK